MYRDIPEDLRELIEPVVVDHGFELVDVELKRGGGPGLLKITIDSPAGDGRVPVQDIARVSRELSTQLDAVDAMPGAYRLEVSSPGLDRILGREKDFAAACAAGREVKITTRAPLDGRKRFRGKLVAFEGGAAGMLSLRSRDGGEAFEIPFSEVARANEVYEFSRADFRGDPDGR